MCEVNKLTDRSKEKVKQQFSKTAEKYVTSSSHSKGSDLALLPEWLQLPKDSIVLDVATGGGHAAKALSPFAGSVFATDLTIEMLEAAQKHLKTITNNVFYVVADAESLPFLSNTFDAVVCRIAAHHFPNPERFVKEAARVLKSGGRFLLIDNIAPESKVLDQFVNQLEKLRDTSHVRSYSVSEWTEWLETHEFVIEKEEIRQKKLGYPEWVSRTTSSKQQITQVDNHLLSADKEIKEHFCIEVENKQIQFFTIDEWMVVSRKSEK